MGTQSRGPDHTVVVQDRSRMYREGLRLLLEATATLRVAEVVTDKDSLEAVCRTAAVGAVVFEVAGVPWNVTGLVERLRRSAGHPLLIGTSPHDDRPHRSVDGVIRVPRTSSSVVFETVLSGGDVDQFDRLPTGSDRSYGPHRQQWRCGPAGAPPSLTRRELQVLALISGGLTTTQIANRLRISAKTVESKRQALFAKLGVQNQSAAVAVAIRTGLLGSGLPHPGDPSPL